LDGEAEALTRKVIELGLNGDINALRLCLDRVIPPRREQPLNFELTKLDGIHDAPRAQADIIAAVANGKLSLSEGKELINMIETYVRTYHGSEKADHFETQADWQRADRIYDMRQAGRPPPY